MRRNLQSGFTLIEAMIAMAILLIGAMGLMGMFTHGLKLNGDAQRLQRASTIAEDLVNQIQARPYQDEVTKKLLANATLANDDDIADTAANFTVSANPISDGLADHGEDALDALGDAWTGIKKEDLGDFERYWDVAYSNTKGYDDTDAVNIAVVVRWHYGAGYRRVVLISGVLNPGRP